MKSIPTHVLTIIYVGGIEKKYLFSDRDDGRVVNEFVDWCVFNIPNSETPPNALRHRSVKIDGVFVLVNVDNVASIEIKEWFFVLPPKAEVDGEPLCNLRVELRGSEALVFDVADDADQTGVINFFCWFHNEDTPAFQLRNSSNETTIVRSEIQDFTIDYGDNFL